MKIVDSHVHTINSPDGNDTIKDILQNAKDKGFYYLATTDHLRNGKKQLKIPEMLNLDLVLKLALLLEHVTDTLKHLRNILLM